MSKTCSKLFLLFPHSFFSEKSSSPFSNLHSIPPNSIPYSNHQVMQRVKQKGDNWWQGIKFFSLMCCVSWPTNKCFAHCLLFKIIFFCIFQYILNLFNIVMMLNKCIIQWFSMDITTRSRIFQFFLVLFPLIWDGKRFKTPKKIWPANSLGLLVEIHNKYVWYLKQPSLLYFL